MSYSSSPKHGQRSRPAPGRSTIRQLSDSEFFSIDNVPMQSICFICNNNYWSTVNPHCSHQTSTGRVLSFCDSFGVRETLERDGFLRLSCLADPFCTACADKISQLQEWMTQLEFLQRGIQRLKEEVGQLMVHSLPYSTNVHGTYPIKARIVRSNNHLLFGHNFKKKGAHIKSYSFFFSSLHFAQVQRTMSAVQFFTNPNPCTNIC